MHTPAAAQLSSLAIRTPKPIMVSGAACKHAWTAHHGSCSRLQMADTVTFKGPWWRALLPEGPQKWLRNTVHTRHQGVAPPCQPHHTPPTHMLARYGCTAKPRRGVASWGWHLAGGGGVPGLLQPLPQPRPQLQARFVQQYRATVHSSVNHTTTAMHHWHMILSMSTVEDHTTVRL